MSGGDPTPPPGRRVLVTAAATRLGALVVQQLERTGGIEAVVAVDERAPASPFALAEFVRLSPDHAQLPRVVAAAEIDVVVDVRAADAVARLDQALLRRHGPATARLVDACFGPDSPVSRVVVAGSAHRWGWDAGLPRFVDADTPAADHALGVLGTALRELEDAVHRAGERTDGATAVALVRLADVVGPAGTGLLGAADRLPAMPTILGFDPPVQVVGEEDAARAVAHVAVADVTGVVPVAADGTLSVTEAVRLLGRRSVPVVPPWGTGWVAGMLERFGVGTATEVAGQLRHGRGVDGRALKATGFRFRATARETLMRAGGHAARREIAAHDDAEPYAADVEAFLRHSPTARRATTAPPAAIDDGIGALAVDDLVALLSSLDPPTLRRLREHERGGPARPRVLDEIDLLLKPRS